MENSPIGDPSDQDYNVILDAEVTADSRLKAREDFVEATSYQIARAVVNGEIDIDGADRLIEEVGGKYPLALDEMAQVIGNVHRASETKVLDLKPNEAQAWNELLARMNPKYKIFKDEDGDISLGLTREE